MKLFGDRGLYGANAAAPPGAAAHVGASATSAAAEGRRKRRSDAESHPHAATAAAAVAASSRGSDKRPSTLDELNADLEQWTREQAATSASSAGADSHRGVGRRASDGYVYHAELDEEYRQRYAAQAAAAGGSSTKVDNIRRDQIEPALRRGDWSGAAVAAAAGLSAVGATASSSAGLPWVTLLIVGAIVLLLIALLLLWSRRRRRKRHEAEVAAAQRVDPTDPNALASVPVDALDDLSKSIVVDVDNAVRTSSNELELAVEEFGEGQTDPFAKAVAAAKVTLTQAFNVRQQLDGTPRSAPRARGSPWRRRPPRG